MMHSTADELGRREHNSRCPDWARQAASIEDSLKGEAASEPLKRGLLLEKLGYSLYRASMQSDNRDEFHDRIRRSIVAYTQAIPLYKEAGRKAEGFRCQAMESYVSYWVSDKAKERKRLLSNGWKLALHSLAAFRKGGDKIGFGRTYNQLASIPGLRTAHEWNLDNRRLMIRQAITFGEEAIESLSDSGHPKELARAYTITSTYLGAVAYFSDFAGRETLIKKSDDFWRRALQA